MATLRELFDNCGWKNKIDGQIPADMENARFAWRGDEVEYARLFLESGLYPERSNVVERTMYLGLDKNGAETLVVMEATNPEYDPKLVAEGMGAMLNASKIKEYFASKLAEK